MKGGAKKIKNAKKIPLFCSAPSGQQEGGAEWVNRALGRGTSFKDRSYFVK